jgi:hypothetical protein
VDADAIRESLKQLQVVEPNAVIIYGADALVGYIAGTLGSHVEVDLADWVRHGRAAGLVWNQEMLDSGTDLVIAFQGERGTQDMMNRVESADVPIVVTSSESHFNPVELSRSGDWLFGKLRMTFITGCSKAGQQWSCDPFKPKST